MFNLFHKSNKPVSKNNESLISKYIEDHSADISYALCVIDAQNQVKYIEACHVDKERIPYFVYSIINNIKFKLNNPIENFIDKKYLDNDKSIAIRWYDAVKVLKQMQECFNKCNFNIR